ncbi:3-oxoacyl-[acyl-carrier-protein] reductase FabG [Thalassoglobus neptunius]|uniref:3-oxoacyl-[acyl-carrier-protein] reductase n=1 Tax=Thalassoglobus neptunius TaxID=1938619 RepID=A0A5C5W9V5_9PLAN|nr:3-oxoacyl-[acyl-carrier-protein] reductase [Thalassoglobus neptunius]TWT47073.1 3-oxoacyl-[acyl-carrier-protein] reductase FabG [Thalassoglobus neptunius]
MFNLDGRVALVTGGSRGIGKAVVEGLARAGAKVAFVYRSSKEAADAMVSELAEQNFETFAIQGDVSSKDDAERIVAEVVEKWERIDILVNNAGIIKDGLLATMEKEDWQAVIDTNLTGVYNFAQSVMRQMMSQRYGRIISVSSVAAEFGNQGQVNYAASKGGIQGLTRCLATEVGRRNITVNAVAPGFIETDMTVAVRNAAEGEIKKRISVRRLGKPEDIANAVVFLASEEAGYVTGHVLTVDGGLTLGGF